MPRKRRDPATTNDTLQCTSCHAYKPHDAFDKARDKHSGYSSHCKECRSIQKKERWRTDPDLRARTKIYRQDHIEQSRASNRISTSRWRAADIERARASGRTNVAKWRKNNPAKWKAMVQEDYKKHSDRYKSQRDKRRALIKNTPKAEKIDRQFIYERDKGICQICFKHCRKKDMSIDHVVPLSKGGNHTKQNCVLAHRSCNSRKGAKNIQQQMRLF